MTEKERVSRKITLLSFWMTVSIVVYHCVFWQENGILTHHTLFVFADRIRGIFGTLALCFFFMKTGFLLFNGVRDKTYKELVLGRTQSLLIPFFVWNGIYLIRSMLRKGYFPIENFAELLVSFTLDPLDGPLWYVFCIWLFVFVTPIWKKAYKNTVVSALVYIGLILFSQVFSESVYGIPAFEETTYLWWTERTFRYLPYYFLGGWIGYSKPSLVWENNWVKRNRFVIYALVIGAWVWLLLWKRNTWIVYQVLPLLMWALIDADWLKKDVKPVVNASFLIYALHAMLIREVSEWGKSGKCRMVL